MRTTEVEPGALADHGADGRLVDLEILGLEDPASVAVLDRLKARFAADAPVPASIEAVSA